MRANKAARACEVALRKYRASVTEPDLIVINNNSENTKSNMIEIFFRLKQLFMKLYVSFSIYLLWSRDHDIVINEIIQHKVYPLVNDLILF